MTLGHHAPLDQASTANAELSPLVLTRLSDVTMRPLAWLWEGRLPRGKIVMLDGDPGVGKSTLALTFAAHVTTGKPWPDGSQASLGDVLILTAEDDPEDTIAPRMAAAGGDLTRVHIIEGARVTTDDGSTYLRAPDLASVAMLGQAVAETGAVLLIVDVMMSHLPDRVDSHKDQSVRSVLAPLARLGMETGVTILLLRHLNKGSGSAQYRGSGSIAIGGQARTVLFAGVDPDDLGGYVLAPGKSNLAVPCQSLRYRLVSAEVPLSAGQVADVGRVEWAGTSRFTADDLARHHSQDDDEEDDALTGRLKSLLSERGGEMLAADALRALRPDFGQVPKSTLARARKRAGITSSKSSYEGGWLWVLRPAAAEGAVEGSTP